MPLDHDIRALPCRRALPALAVALWASLGIGSTARAASYVVRAETVGRATRMQRADLSTAAPRTIMQGLSLEAYDLLGRRDGSLSASLAVRYRADLGLRAPERQAAAFAGQYNAARVDLAQLRWRPASWVTVTAGRQWAWGALGSRDLDGVTLRLSPRLAPGWRAWVEGAAGRDVQISLGLWGSDQWDVQGVPVVAADGAIPARWIALGRAGLRWGEQGALEVAYQRRWAPDPGGGPARVGEARLGAGVSAQVARRLTLSADAAYVLSLDRPERLGLRGLWGLPGTRDVTLSFGVARRRPWFDSASIFNIFGANPHDEAHLSVSAPARWARGTIEARGWVRALYEDDEVGALAIGSQRAVAPGVAVAHRSRVQVARRAVEWTSQLSAQLGPDDLGGKQWLVDSGARAPLWLPGLFIQARTLLLVVDRDHHRLDDAVAWSALLGADVGLTRRGRLSLFVSHRVESSAPAATSLYATFDVEVWP